MEVKVSTGRRKDMYTKARIIKQNRGVERESQSQASTRRHSRAVSVSDSVAEWSKAIDLKSIILWMRRFKSCHCRF